MTPPSRVAHINTENLEILCTRHTPSLAYSLLYACCQCGRIHVAIASIGLRCRFAYDQFRKGDAAASDLEESGVGPLAGRCSQKSGTRCVFACALCESNRNVRHE